jgi:hypothetical protein
MRPSGVNGPRGLERNLPIDHQHLLHLAVEVRIPLLQVVADLVGLDLLLVKDTPYGALARPRE